MSHEPKEKYEYTTNFHRNATKKAHKAKALSKAKREVHYKGDDKLVIYKESK